MLDGIHIETWALVKTCSVPGTCSPDEAAIPLSSNNGNTYGRNLRMSSRSTDNGRPVLQPILFHKTTVIQTKIVVQHILTSSMTPVASAHCPRLEFRLQAVRGIHHVLPRKRGTPNETPAYFGGSARMRTWTPRRVWLLTICKKLNITFASHARSRRWQGH